METISSTTFLDPIFKRIRELYEVTHQFLIVNANKTDAELHYARGKLNGINELVTIINEENDKILKQIRESNNLIEEESTDTQSELV